MKNDTSDRELVVPTRKFSPPTDEALEAAADMAATLPTASVAIVPRTAVEAGCKAASVGGVVLISISWAKNLNTLLIGSGR